MLDVSVVMPCLNEEETIGPCIEKAREGIRRLGLHGEIIVCDNGSTDRSVEIATRLGARVFHERRKGYGSAYMRGISEARAEYIIMGDSDDTYDFADLEPFLKPLREGYELVMGSRFSGTILPGAMTFSHRYIGNPVLSGILKLFYRVDISDAHCGMRSFTKDAYARMRLQTTGMEFASEMVINAGRERLKIAEVPITYYPRKGESKLETWRDGWRHLRFMLLYSPTHLFLLPGLLLLLPRPAAAAGRAARADPGRRRALLHPLHDPGQHAHDPRLPGAHARALRQELRAQHRRAARRPHAGGHRAALHPGARPARRRRDVRDRLRHRRLHPPPLDRHVLRLLWTRSVPPSSPPR